MNLRLGDCLRVFAREPDGSFDALVSDLPAGIGFLGRSWDRDHGHRDKWIAYWAKRLAMARRKARPGAYSLTWALPRTSHWTACALDDAGWYIQDTIHHVFGQGWCKNPSALKPAHELWILARNGGGGALQIDACRVPRSGPIAAHHGTGRQYKGGFAEPYKPGDSGAIVQTAGSWPTNLLLSHCPECAEREGGAPTAPADRCDTPVFDCLAACGCGASVLARAGGEPPGCRCGSPMFWACPVADMDRQSGTLRSGLLRAGTRRSDGNEGGYSGGLPRVAALQDFGGTTGGASRFFPCFQYAPKASGGEKHAGCEDFYWREDKRSPFGFQRVSESTWRTLDPSQRDRGNVHATVKNLALLEWLCSLVAKPGDRLGDVTLGSGGTAIAWHRICKRAGVEASFLGAEICSEALALARARLRWWQGAGPDARPRRTRGGVVIGARTRSAA